MRIYDYLFYKTFVAAQKSRNFHDTPVLGGIIFVDGCVIMNIFSVVAIIEGLGFNTGFFELPKWFKYPFVTGLFFFLLFYYKHNGRYKRIVERYEAKEYMRKSPHPAIVIVCYVVISVMLMFLAAFFKN